MRFLEEKPVVLMYEYKQKILYNANSRGGGYLTISELNKIKKLVDNTLKSYDLEGIKSNKNIDDLNKKLNEEYLNEYNKKPQYGFSSNEI